MKRIFISLFILFSFSMFSQTFPSEKQAFEDVSKDTYWNNLLKKKYGFQFSDLKFEKKYDFKKGYTTDLEPFSHLYDYDLIKMAWLGTASKEGIKYTFTYVSAYKRSEVNKLNVTYLDRWIYHSSRSGFYPPILESMNGNTMGSINEDILWGYLMKLEGGSEEKIENGKIKVDARGLSTYTSFDKITQSNRKLSLRTPTERIVYFNLHGSAVKKDRLNQGWITGVAENTYSTVAITQRKAGSKWNTEEIEIYAPSDGFQKTEDALFLMTYGEKSFAELVGDKIISHPKKDQIYYKRIVKDSILSAFKLANKGKIKDFKTKMIPYVDKANQDEILNSMFSIVFEAQDKFCDYYGANASIEVGKDQENMKLSYTILLKRDEATTKELMKKYKNGGMSKALLKETNGEQSRGKFKKYFSFEAELKFVNHHWVLTEPIKHNYKIPF